MFRPPSRPRHRQTAHDDDPPAPPEHVDAAALYRFCGRPGHLPARAARVARAQLCQRGHYAGGHDVHPYAERHARHCFRIDTVERQPHADHSRDAIGNAVVLAQFDAEPRRLDDTVGHARTVVDAVDDAQFKLIILT